MGAMNLGSFEIEIEVATGGHKPPGVSLATYVNFAYYEIAGAIDFPELLNTYQFSVSSGENSMAIPQGDVLLLSLQNINVEGAGTLGYRTPQDLFRFPLLDMGPPKIWTRIENTIHFRPMSDASYSIFTVLREVPQRLITAENVTILPVNYDPAISLLATHYAKLTFGHDDAMDFYNRAVQFLASQLKETDLVMREGGLGRDIRLAMQGGA